MVVLVGLLVIMACNYALMKRGHIHDSALAWTSDGRVPDARDVDRLAACDRGGVFWSVIYPIAVLYLPTQNLESGEAHRA